MSQQGRPRGPHGEHDDWWSQLYDPGSPDTGRSRAGDTLDDRYASVRRTMGPSTAPAGSARSETGGDSGRTSGADPQQEPAPPEDKAEAEEKREPESVPEERQPEPEPEPESDWEWEAKDDPEPDPAPPAPHRTQRLRLPEPQAEPQSPPRIEPEPEPAPPSRPAAAPAESADPRATPEPAGAEPIPTVAEGVDARSLLEADNGQGISEGGEGQDLAEAGDRRSPADEGGVPGLADDEESLRPAHVGERPPTYEAEPATFPAADPAALSELVPDTVLDGAHYGGLTLRAASLRGDSARHRGALRRDALLTARFGSGASALLLVAVAAGGRAATGGHRAAREICHSIGGVVGRSHERLAEDIRADRRGALKSGLQRLTERCYGKLRAQAAALGVQPEEYTADLRCLLLSADPRCRIRVFFGSGDGGLFQLRGGVWRDIEPGSYGKGGAVLDPGAEAGGFLDPTELADLAALSVPVTPGQQPVPPPARQDREPFRFCATEAQRGDTLLLCSPGLAGPLRTEPAFGERLARSWADRPEPPGLAAFLADVQLRVRGYADDRTAVAVWEG